MFNAIGDTWKRTRTTFTPIFTSGKMKTMLHFIKEGSNHVTAELAKKSEIREEFDLKEVYGKLSLDTIASCAFGIDAQCFTNKKSAFVKHTKNVLTETTLDIFVFIAGLVPGLKRFLEIFNINIYKPTSIRYLRDVVLNSMEARRKSKERRNDMIDFMLDCIDGEKSEDEGFIESKDQFHKDQAFSHDRKGAKLTMDDIVATALTILVAGYDTTAITLSYLSYSMAKHPDIQQKLQEEVDQAFEDNSGELPDYSTIMTLPYLDMVIQETLRKYPPVGMNTRTCTQDYRIPGTAITVRKGDFLTFSVAGFHEDPEHFSHPEDFYPEHFSQEEKAARSA